MSEAGRSKTGAASADVLKGECVDTTLSPLRGETLGAEQKRGGTRAVNQGRGGRQSGDRAGAVQSQHD